MLTVEDDKLSFIISDSGGLLDDATFAERQQAIRDRQVGRNVYAAYTCRRR